jgi:exodeoxyribonuclease-3
MRIATWNVNSLKARLPRVEEWLGYARPDILCLQETKLADAAFPHLAFEAMGYEVETNGDGRWNGVAIASRVGIADPARGMAVPHEGDPSEARIISATCGGVRVSSVYVPNGRGIDQDHYRYKLKWLGDLRAHLDATCRPDQPVAVCGDFNIAPDQRDVAPGISAETHTSDEVRSALRGLEEWGLVDGFRRRYDQDRLYSWWDYRAGDFHNHRGLRIDLILLSAPLADVTWALVDRNARKGKLPSDHAPVLVDTAWDPAGG